MKTFFTWLVTVAGITAGAVFAFQAVQKGRRTVKDALGEAEAIADRTRAALEETENALRKTRAAI
jgi:hypothetical protein